ncbi:MAG: RNA-directed DNA polymerase [Planctomycetaceae bacterium]|nr:RNA-directed DNA polymerase [Planctomycetaceae bacterium]
MAYVIAGIVVVIAAAGLAAAMRFRKPRRSYTLGNLIDFLELTPDDARVLKQPSYSSHRIPKRSGGYRLLEVPDEQTKMLQRRLLRRVLSKLSAHPAAVGFETAKSIVDAARPHTSKGVVIRIDITDFFQSTTTERVAAWFRGIGWDADSVDFLTKFVCHDGHLPQGAPTSPRLSNLINAGMDTVLQRIATERGGTYTRYADDITISFRRLSGRRARGVVQHVRRTLTAFGYRVNTRKTRILRNHQQQTVTGLVVNRTISIPRKQRRKLRAIRHRIANGQPATMTTDQLAGWDAFLAMVEQQR